MKRRDARRANRAKSSVSRAADRAALMLESLELRRMLSYEAALSVTPAGLGTAERFGSSVATNGSLALVGAPTDGSGAGAAYLLDLSDPQNPVTTPIANPAALPQGGDQFGAAVTFVGDDLAITAPEAREAGVPKVYVIDTDTNAVQTLVSPFADAESQFFGATIASIGNDVFVSIGTPPGSPGQVAIARYETGAGTDAAADDVYFIDSNVFGQVGMAVKDGKLLASGTLDGIATVFEINPVNDAITPKFTAPDTDPSEEGVNQDPIFGFAIAATDGSVLVTSPLFGQVYEFADGAGDNGTLFASSPSASPGLFGFSIAVNQAAGTVVIGDLDATVSTGAEGEAYAYALSDGELLGTLQSGNADGAEEFGHAVAALPDGAFLVTDAKEDSDGTADAGAAYVFEPTLPSNQAPIADAGADQSAVRNQTITLDAGASSDPDEDTLTYAWDLDDDGQFDDAFGAVVTTSFDTAGTHIVSVQVSDGSLSDEDELAVTVATNAVVGGVLYVGGESGSDSISVVKNGTGGTSVTLNGATLPNYTGGQVVIFGGSGADNITVSPSANVAVEIHGGAGNDTINGGSLDDILVGDGGNDSVFGGNGRDIVIGGVGADSLYGEVNDDVLVAASTAIDNNSAALAAALNAWVASHDVSAFGSGAITADGDEDVVSGKQGADTFFLGTEDILLDLKKDDDFFLI